MLFGFLGLREDVGGLSRPDKKEGAQPPPAVETDGLEWARSMRNALCSGEMHRDHAELRLRRQHTGAQLTLKHESVGIEQD